MRINHNIQALNAYRNLYQNQFNSSKNLEKLSSGLRINRAADDAAGLAISEKMRSQIRGLKVSERNALDGISLMQTAEGAMTEVHSMVQRMRELAVQAANDTNTPEDREHIQKEIDQLLTEIDSIAEKTEFNTRKLLDGSSAADTQFVTGQMVNTNIKDVPTVIDPSMESGRYEIQINNTPEYQYKLNQPGAGVSESSVLSVNLEGVFQNNEAQNTNMMTAPQVIDSSVSDSPGSYQLNIKSITRELPDVTNGSTGITPATNDFFADPSTTELPYGDYQVSISNANSTTNTADIAVYSPDGTLIEKKEGVSTGTGNSSVTFGSGNRSVELDLSGTIQDGTATIGMEATIDYEVHKINPDGTMKSAVFDKGNAKTSDGVLTGDNGKFETTFNPSATTGTSNFDVTSDLAFGEYTIQVSDYQVDNAGVKSANVQVLDPDGFLVGETAAEIGENGSVQTIGMEDGKKITIDTTKISQAGTARVQVEGKMKVGVSEVAANGTETPITFEKELTTRNGIIQHGGLEMEFGMNVRQGESQFDLTNKSLAFQIGANTGQNVNIDVPQLSTVKLGIEDVDVRTHESASDSIFKLEQALNMVSSVRAKLGATQNRLEHTISNVQATHENLTASESRIRDADMALQMTQFTKNNILNQSAQAMLAQANQLPQGVLQLLQG